MSSYHTSFTYKDKNSWDEGLIIAAFEPDNGFRDSFLSMDNISDDYYDGTKRFDYGSKYNTSAEIQITLIKKHDADMSLKEFRNYAKWLTGAKTNSWLDMYVGDHFAYAFLGKFTNFEQYKLDGRTIGIRLTFSSLSPWAFSAPQVFDCDIGQELDLLEENNEAIVVKKSAEYVPFGIDDNGVLCANALDENSYFIVDEKGVAYIDTSYRTIINNKSDDLYTYIDLDIDYINKNSTEVFIKNNTLNEETVIKALDTNEIISISAKQFIVSYSLNDKGERVQNVHKIFGDDFNFVWPRLAPGENDFEVYGSGHGKAQFTYRYPMKIGDCTIDIDANGNGIYCDCDESDINNFTIDWANIVNTPITLGGYGITDAYTNAEVDEIVENIEITGGGGGNTNVNEQELNDMLADILGL
jgi:hypothetical protein